MVPIAKTSVELATSILRRRVRSEIHPAIGEAISRTTV